MIPADSGIPCQGLDDAFLAEDTRKSNLLLEGQLLDGQGQPDLAAEKYATAAAIEERLAVHAREIGLPQLARVHELSAVGCSGAGRQPIYGGTARSGDACRSRPAGAFAAARARIP